MSIEMWFTLGTLAVAILLFITEWLRVDIVALGVVVVLMISGVLTTSEAIAGFSNSVVLIVASLFIVGGAVRQTGLASMLGNRILDIAGDSETRLIVVVMLASAGMSGFMSDTGTVAVLLPAIVHLSRTANISPSRLLIPLSYGALLGGATTLIGTTPNIIVTDLLREQGQSTFSFFSYTPVGLAMVATGAVFMVMLGRRILPDHRSKQEIEQQVTSPKELLDVYRLPDDLYQLRIPAGSNLEGKTIADARLRSDFDVTVIEVRRMVAPQPLVKFGDQSLVLQSDAMTAIHPEADTLLRANDVLVTQGGETAVKQAVAFWNLTFVPVTPADTEMLISNEAGIAEVLLPPRSTLIGKTLVETRFGSSYRLTVLGISRPGTGGRVDLKTAPLQVGDTLLVQGLWSDIIALKKSPRDFVVMGRPEAMLGAPYQHKAPFALLIMLAMVVALIAGVADVATISMTAGLAMVLTGCLTMDDAYAAIDWKSIVLIAGMLPMSTALEKVDLISLVAEGVTDHLGSLGPLIIMGLLFLLTSAFTQVISNTATTVLMAPIAFETAVQMDVAPQAFLMAVSIAASMAFASPVASPVNTLVMGAGNYRFADYIKIGVPMILLMLLVTSIGVPLLWPF